MSCSKKEDAVRAEPKSSVEKHRLSVPLKDGRTFVETKAQSSRSISSVLPHGHPGKFSQIPQPDAQYLRSTTLMTLKKPAAFSIINCIADDQLKLTFVDSLIKMPGYPNGWTALWNEQPFVEKQSPTVLYTRQQNKLTILLSKYVRTFGFELAPNMYNTFSFSVGFYDSKYNPAVAALTQNATTPSGATLFAVRSEKPFNTIEISFAGNLNTGNHPWGFGIAHIRYALD